MDHAGDRGHSPIPGVGCFLSSFSSLPLKKVCVREKSQDGYRREEDKIQINLQRQKGPHLAYHVWPILRTDLEPTNLVILHFPSP